MSRVIQSFARYEKALSRRRKEPSAKESETTHSSKQNTRSNFPLPSGLNLPHQCVIKCMWLALGLFQTDKLVREQLNQR